MPGIGSDVGARLVQNSSMTTDWEIGVSGEPKADCSTRQKTSSAREVAKPHITIAVVKPAMPQIMARRRPKRLATGQRIGHCRRNQVGRHHRRFDRGSPKGRLGSAAATNVGDSQTSCVQGRDQRAGDEKPHGVLIPAPVGSRPSTMPQRVSKSPTCFFAVFVDVPHTPEARYSFPQQTTDCRESPHPTAM